MMSEWLAEGPATFFVYFFISWYSFELMIIKKVYQQLCIFMCWLPLVRIVIKNQV